MHLLRIAVIAPCQKDVCVPITRNYNRAASPRVLAFPSMNVARSQSLPAFLSILSILVIALPVVAAADDPRLSIPTDPFADPRNDPFNPLKYITSNALTGVAVCERSPPKK